jgi:phage terminase small subunit
LSVRPIRAGSDDEHGHRVKVITSAVSLVPSDRLDENTAAAIAAVSHRARRAPSASRCITTSSTGSTRKRQCKSAASYGSFFDNRAECWELANRIVINLRHERFAQALAQGKAANEAYALAGYKANDGNASRLKGNERISARVREIVGRAAERAEVSLERVLRELAAIAFSDISKAVTWGVQVREEDDEHGNRVKVITSAVSLVPSDRLDENTAAAIAAVSQSATGALSIKMRRDGGAGEAVTRPVAVIRRTTRI